MERRKLEKNVGAMSNRERYRAAPATGGKGDKKENAPPAEGNLRQKPNLAIAGNGSPKENVPGGTPAHGARPTLQIRKEQVGQARDEVKTDLLAPLDAKVMARIEGALPLNLKSLRKER